MVDSQSIRNITRVVICVSRFWKPRFDRVFLWNQEQAVMFCGKLETLIVGRYPQAASNQRSKTDLATNFPMLHRPLG